MSRRYSDSAAGFTLIELLVAMVIFAVLSTGMYTVFSSYQTTRDITERDARRLADLQRFFNVVSRDLQQAISRPVRDEFSFGPTEVTPALQGTSESVWFTRAGWNLPVNSRVRRSELQRVGYRLENGIVRREHYRVVDSPDSSALLSASVLGDVQSLRFRYVQVKDPSGAGPRDAWPPDALPPTDGDPNAVIVPRESLLPDLVEVRVTLADYGEIVRLFDLPKGHPW